MPIWLIQLLISVVVGVVSTLAEQAFGPKPAATAAAGTSETLQVGGTVPAYFVMGTWALQGKREYVNTWGTAGDTPNAYRTEVISFGDLPITALIGLFESSQAMTLTSSGHTTQGYPVAERANAGSNRFWQEFFSGSQVTANSFLTGKFGSDPTRPWLTDMIGLGIPYATLTAMWDRTIWTGDPNCMFAVRGIPLYDPRLDSTAGGSGTQRLNDQTTWAFSDNRAVMIYNILIGIRYQNAIVWGGRCAQTQLPYAVWAAAMNVCDVAISLVAGGTEKQFRGGRVVQFTDRPTDVIQELLVGANARIAECAGTYTILVGPVGAADGAFTDTDIIVTEAGNLDPFPNLDNTINGATAAYLEPSEAWNRKDATPYYRSDLEASDRGQRHASALDLTASVFSGTQAQRILKATVEEGRRFLKHVMPMTPQFGSYRPLNTLAWTSAENAYSTKQFLISAWTEESNGNVILGFQEINPADHGWTPGSDESALSFAPMTPIVPGAQVMTSLSVTQADFVDGSGTARKPGIAATWPSGQVDVRAVLVTVREKVSGNIEWSGEINYDRYPAGGTIPHAFLSLVTYQVQADYIPYSGRPHTPSSWLDITTSNVGTDLPDFGPRITALVAFYNTAIADLQEIVGKIGGILDAQDFANYQDKQTITNKVTSQVGSAIAISGTLFQAATSAIAAEATARIAAMAAFGTAFAAGLIEFDSAVTGSGGSAVATITIKVKANVGDASADSGLVIQASADGSGGTTSQVLIKANQLFITDGTHTSDAFTFDATTGTLVLKSLLFQSLKDISTNHVSINGNTGAMTLSS